MAGCSTSHTLDHDFDDLIDSLSSRGICEDLQILRGDPNHFGPARGFHCIGQEDALVAYREYLGEQATSAAVSDWSEVVTVENQIVWADNWFAIGPPDMLRGLRDLLSMSPRVPWN